MNKRVKEALIRCKERFDAERIHFQDSEGNRMPAYIPELDPADMLLVVVDDEAKQALREHIGSLR